MKIVLSVIGIALLSFLFSDIFYFDFFPRANHGSDIIEFLIFFTAGISSAFLFRKYPLKSFLSLVITSQILGLLVYCFAFAFSDIGLYCKGCTNTKLYEYLFDITLINIKNLWFGFTWYPLEGIMTFFITILSIYFIKLRIK